MAETVYKDGLTLDGRLPLGPGVTHAKLKAMKELVEGTIRGNRIASGTLKESVTTSDALFSFAHIVNLNTFPKFDEAPRTWTQIASRRGLTDFRPAVFYSLDRQWEDGTLGNGEPRHISPVVPEGIAYPYATLRGESYEGNSLVKRGFKVGLTWEAMINDTVGFVRDLPGEIVRVALDTEEYEVYNALISGVGAGQAITAGTNPDGTEFLANASLSRAALIGAIAQLGQRKIDGRQVVINGGYNLIVAPGQRANAEYQINNMLLVSTAKGSDPVQTFNNNGFNPLTGITVIESEYVVGAAWYLVPKTGQRRPILELGALIGHESPELRVNNAQGTYLGGSAISPFEGSFDNDAIDMRVRQVIKGLNWTPDLIVWSSGANA